MYRQSKSCIGLNRPNLLLVLSTLATEVVDGCLDLVQVASLLGKRLADCVMECQSVIEIAVRGLFQRNRTAKQCAATHAS